MKRLFNILIIVCWVPIYGQNLPCAGYEMRSDEMYYRGSGSGVDADSITARRKAIMIARQRIVTQVEVVVNNTTELYIKTYATNMDAQTKSYMRSQTQTAASKLMIGSRVICEETIRRKDDTFESSVAMEVATINMENIIPEDTHNQIDWIKYKEILHTQIQFKQ